MTCKPLAGIAFLLFPVLPALALAEPIADQAEMDRIVSGFYATSLDEGTVHPVTNLVIKKDIATFTLKSGALYLAKPIAGSVRTAVFVGDGTATIKPVRAMDRGCLDMTAKDHLNKTPGGEITTAFDRLMISSLDRSIEELVKTLPPVTPPPDFTAATATLKERLQIMDGLEIPFDLEMLAARAGFPDGPTYVSFKSADYGWLDYVFDPRDTLEVLLYSVEQVGTTLRPRILVHTHQTADFDAKGNYVADMQKDQKDWLDATKYDMQITIPDRGHFQAEGTVTFTPLIDNLSILRFNLVNNVSQFTVRSDETNAKRLFLKSIGTQDGKPLPHVHKRHQVWVVPPEPLKIGTSYAIKFSVDAETIFQISTSHFFIVNDAAWFPQHGYLGGQATMDWTVKAKKPLYATGSGRTVKESTEGLFNVTQLAFDRSVWLPFLIFGQYTKETDAYKSAAGGTNVNLALFYAVRAEFNVEDNEGDLQTVAVTVPGGKPKGILGESKDIIKFYEEIYGPFPFPELHVAQMAPGMGFGQGPAGFIQLTGEAFMSSGDIANFGGTANADFFHEFFSHEVAHQYWGHNIKWATDEDVWLSESFAEYSAGMVVMGLLGPERFQGKLKQWEDRAKLADPHGTVAWANNMRGENGGAWRTYFLYNKGPYIVHMLRMQVGHENYVKAMKSLMKKYDHKQITTEMLRQEFETVVGYKLDYFFDQWFRGTGIPTIDYSYDVKPSEDGKFVATVKMSQRDKARVKVMQVPIFYHFGKEVVVKNRPMLQAEDVYQIKLPSKPDRITVDDYNTLLADIVGQGAAAN